MGPVLLVCERNTIDWQYILPQTFPSHEYHYDIDNRIDVEIDIALSIRC